MHAYYDICQGRGTRTKSNTRAAVFLRGARLHLYRDKIVQTSLSLGGFRVEFRFADETLRK